MSRIFFNRFPEDFHHRHHQALNAVAFTSAQRFHEPAIRIRAAWHPRQAFESTAVVDFDVEEISVIRLWKLRFACFPTAESLRSHLLPTPSLSLAIMIASSSQAARIPFPQAKAPTARQIRKAEKLEKRSSMHGSRHPGRLDGAIGKLTQVLTPFINPLSPPASRRTAAFLFVLYSRLQHDRPYVVC